MKAISASIIVPFIFSGCSNDPASSNLQVGGITNLSSKATRPDGNPNRVSKKSKPSRKLHPVLSRARLEFALNGDAVPLSEDAERKLASLVSAASPMSDVEAKLINMEALPAFNIVSKENPAVGFEWHGDWFYTGGTHFTNKSAGGLWYRLVSLTQKEYTIETFGREASAVIEGY